MSFLTTRKSRSSLLGIAAATGMILAPLAPAFAADMPADSATPPASQSAPQKAPETAPSAAQPAASFSDAQIDSFVDAAVEVSAVRDSYLPQIQAEKDQTKAKELTQKAQQEMTAAVEKTDGIDVPTYNAISKSAQQDPQLNDRLVAMIQKRVAAPDSNG